MANGESNSDIWNATNPVSAQRLRILTPAAQGFRSSRGFEARTHLFELARIKPHPLAEQTHINSRPGPRRTTFIIWVARCVHDSERLMASRAETTLFRELHRESMSGEIRSETLMMELRELREEPQLRRAALTRPAPRCEHQRSATVKAAQRRPLLDTATLRVHLFNGVTDEREHTLNRDKQQRAKPGSDPSIRYCCQPLLSTPAAS